MAVIGGGIPAWPRAPVWDSQCDPARTPSIVCGSCPVPRTLFPRPCRCRRAAVALALAERRPQSHGWMVEGTVGHHQPLRPQQLQPGRPLSSSQGPVAPSLMIHPAVPSGHCPLPPAGCRAGVTRGRPAPQLGVPPPRLTPALQEPARRDSPRLRAGRPLPVQVDPLGGERGAGGPRRGGAPGQPVPGAAARRRGTRRSRRR